MQIASTGDNLHEISILFSEKKKEKQQQNITNWSSAELAQRGVKGKAIYMSSKRTSTHRLDIFR